ncbi:MAG: DUF5654 family protein [Methanotrichaceae archaeon]|nr:DUF5654 family protein [Methanotrichaceae archaeon]MDD1758224.1 DUF5654 family protein [Methanotrichaceae archaeon]
MKRDVLEKISELMTAAFGLVAALAWNEAIKSLFNEGGPLYFVSGGGVWVYALLVTMIAVCATIWIGQLIAKAGVTKTKECPFCKESIPKEAVRCSRCTSDLSKA